eukprot:m.123304 g.123304  ORF g.123304 m.123304 type:complete len:218 (-) comp13455_c0_seq4:2473-3126(-)
MAGPAPEFEDFGEEDEGAKEMVRRLQSAWVSEKAAPEILQYETEIVQTLLDMVSDQDEQSREHASDTVAHRFLFNVYQMEIARIRFLIRSYLRTRLKKIEKYASHTIKDEALHSRLSDYEVQYAVEYRDNVTNHMTSAVLKDLPPTFSRFDADTDKEKMVPKPNLDTHVFCLAKENLGMVQVGVGDGIAVQINRGDLYILRYTVAAEFLETGKVELL